jgi:hypothetical protein
VKSFPPVMLTYLGLIAQGDVGPYTTYTRPGKKTVTFLQAPPKKPPSRRQIHQRNKYGLAALLWWQLSPATRASWRHAAARASLRITGWNLWLAVHSGASPLRAEAVFRRARIPFPA